MDWGSEPYVRIYKRDTAAWIALPWQARAVFYELKRKVDRAGVLKLGRRGLGALPPCLMLPPEVVHVGITALLEEGTVADGGDRLTIPDYIESEETERNDAARQRDLRERRRDKALATGATPEEARVATRPDRYAPPADPGNALGHAGSRRVTLGHAAFEQPIADPAAPPLRVVGQPVDNVVAAPGGVEVCDSPGVGHARVTLGHSVPSVQCSAVPSVHVAGSEPAAKRRRRTPGRPMPEGWAPDETAQRKAAELGLSLELEEASFRDWTTAKGMLYADWQAGFRSHLANAATRPGRVNGGGPQRDRAAEIWAEAQQLRKDGR